MKGKMAPLVLAVIALWLFALGLVYITKGDLPGLRLPSLSAFLQQEKPLPTVTPSQAQDAAAPRSFYFAEGDTTAGVRTWFAVLNPGDTTAVVTLRLYPESGQPVQRVYQMAPETFLRIDAEALLPGARFGAEVYSPQRVYTGRLTRNAYDGVMVMGQVLSQDWYFPDISAGDGLATHLAILNPHAEQIAVNIMALGDNKTRSEKIVDVPPRSRRTVPMAVPLLSGRGAVVVRSSRAIAAEYTVVSGGGQAIYGGPGVPHQQLGKSGYVTLAATEAGNGTRLVLYNPTGLSTPVQLWRLDGGRRQKLSSVQLPAEGRADIDLNKILPGQRLAVQFSTEVDVAAQAVTTLGRAAYSVAAVPKAALTWFAPMCPADGEHESYIAVLNPQEQPAQVTIVYLIEGKESLTKVYTIPALSRMTQRVRDEVVGWQDAAGPSKVTALTIKSDRPVLCQSITLFAGSPGATASPCIAGP